MTVNQNESVDSLKERIESESGIDSQMFSLVHQGSVLSSLEGLEDNSNIYLNVKLLGGKKGKKKAYTTKKKNKHMHRKEKLATLKLYSVKNGKV